MVAAGVDARTLLRDAGVQATVLYDADARRSLEQHRALWGAARAQLPNTDLGLTVGTRMALGRFGLLEHLIQTAQTLREAVEQAAQYWRLVTDDDKEIRLLEVSTSSQAAPRGAWLDFRTAQCGVDAAYVADMVYIHRFIRALIDPNFVPLGIQLMAARPQQTEPYLHIFGLVPEFSCSSNAIGLREADLDRLLLGRDAQLAAVVGARADEALQRLDSGTTGLVLTHLRDRTRDAELGSTAKALGLSPRTLQRRLHSEGQSFRSVLDEARRRAAYQYLAHTQVGLTEAGERVGFSDPSGFHHAVRRWFQCTPSEVRRRVALVRDPE